MWFAREHQIRPRRPPVSWMDIGGATVSPHRKSPIFYVYRGTRPRPYRQIWHESGEDIDFGGDCSPTQRFFREACGFRGVIRPRPVGRGATELCGPFFPCEPVPIGRHSPKPGVLWIWVVWGGTLLWVFSSYYYYYYCWCVHYAYSSGLLWLATRQFCGIRNSATAAIARPIPQSTIFVSVEISRLVRDTDGRPEPWLSLWFLVW